MGERIFNVYFKSNQTEDLINRDAVKKVSAKSSQIKANMSLKMMLLSLRECLSYAKEQ